MRPAALSCLGLVLLAACGPIPRADAERNCFQRAWLAAHPRGSVAFGIGSGGRKGAGAAIAISGDYLMGRDPSAVYDQCVMQQSGQPPSQPLYTRPDWKG